MPLVSILSSTYAPSAAHIGETIEAIEQLALPEGWELEWVVQEDGDKPALAERFAHLPHVRYRANNRQLGLAPTRNLALARVRGELTQLLDHDDILLPHALTTMIRNFEEHPIHWAIGQADDLMPDGSRVGFPPALPFGIVKAGQVNDWAIEHQGNWPLHVAATMIRTNVLRSVGGWVGVPIDDDLAMFALLSEVTDGCHEKEITWLYRQHPTQVHKQPQWQEWSNEGRGIALQRVMSLREARLFLDPAMPLTFGRPIPNPEVGPLHPDKLRHDA